MVCSIMFSQKLRAAKDRGSLFLIKYCTRKRLVDRKP
jgi:hypothetical protein